MDRTYSHIDLDKRHRIARCKAFPRCYGYRRLQASLPKQRVTISEKVVQRLIAYIAKN